MWETVAPPALENERQAGDAPPLRVVLLGGFGMRPKATMAARALPMGQALAARGHTVLLIVPPWDHPEDSGKVWEASGVRVVNVALPRARRLPRIVGALRELTRAAQPDVVHIFKPKGYSGLALPLLREYPCVLDHDDWEGAGGWNDRGGYGAAQRLLFGWQETHLPRRAAHVTAASRTLVMQQRRLGVPAARITYLPNALAAERHAAWRDEGRIAEAAQAIRTRHGLAGPTLLVYTRFVEFPPERVAALFERVRAHVPGVRLLIVGTGMHGAQSAGAAALARFGEAVARAGFVPLDDIPGYLRAADAAVVPFDDTLVNRAKCSVKTLDLLAAGQAVVATAVGENREAIRHGVTGLLAPPGDLDALADAAVGLLRHPERARALGAAARARAWAEQTWAAQGGAVAAIYRRVARSRAA